MTPTSMKVTPNPATSMETEGMSGCSVFQCVTRLLC